MEAGEAQVAAEAIRHFTRQITAILVVLTVLLLGLGVATLTISKRESRTSGQAAQLARHNCANLKSLAGIERIFIERQQQQTQALLERGLTFGIPKEQLPALVKANEESQREFLEAFDALSLTNC